MVSLSRITQIGLSLAAFISNAATNEPAVVLTPKPSAAPRVNGPTIYGARPFHPFSTEFLHKAGGR